MHVLNLDGTGYWFCSTRRLLRNLCAKSSDPMRFAVYVAAQMIRIATESRKDQAIWM